MHRGIDPYTVAPRFKVSCERPGGRQVGPGPGCVELFERMGSAHSPIYTVSAHSRFPSRTLVSGWGGGVFRYCASWDAYSAYMTTYCH